ncbi:hypothetical protein Bca52824_073171 [Brassica carinata]|uniref:Uncharacterized protein n=1 Tax=Brassica carinata TaxID=52824 RepID=A0A8X7Q9S4_BRACI|nr:hypothetical protein Bca52824_073171 [Brassica carinata]
MSNHERGMEKTTDHLHRQTVNSKKNCLTWRSKLGQQLELLRQLKTQAISRLCLLLTKAKATNPMKLTVLTRNHNTVGGLGEEALFPVYGMEIIGLYFSLSLPGRMILGKSLLQVVMPALLNLQQFSKYSEIKSQFSSLSKRTSPRTGEIARAQIKGLQRR